MLAEHRSPKPKSADRHRGGAPINTAIGEMDIIAVFETVGGGSIPSWPAKQCLVSLMVELCFYTAVTAVRFCHEVPCTLS
jgi:hypothetical protein